MIHWKEELSLKRKAQYLIGKCWKQYRSKFYLKHDRKWLWGYWQFIKDTQETESPFDVIERLQQIINVNKQTPDLGNIVKQAVVAGKIEKPDFCSLCRKKHANCAGIILIILSHIVLSGCVILVIL